MKIIIDLQGAQTESRYRGIGRYSLALAKAIAKNPRQHEIFILGNAWLDRKDPGALKIFENILPSRQILEFHAPPHTSFDCTDNRWRNRAAQIIRENFLRNLDADIVFTSSLFEGGVDDAITSAGRLQTEAISSVSLYDLIPMADPGKYLATPWVKDWYSEKIQSLRKFDQLLSISEYSKSQAEQLLGIESKKISNISTACDAIFSRRDLGQFETQKLKARYGVREILIMCSGALDERKNIPRLVHAFSMLPLEFRNNRQLLIAGKGNSEEKSNLTGLIKKLNLEDQILLPGYVPDDDLASLISLAEFFVFPSLNEGFGLPPLEAMTCGTPTITSNSTSLPEVVGWDEAMFDPESVSSISNAMQRVITDPKFREQLRTHAISQAAKFSWEKSANLALDAFEEMAQSLGKGKSKIIQGWRSQEKQISDFHREMIFKISEISPPEVAPSEDDLRQLAQAISNNTVITRGVLIRQPQNELKSWRIEGPFDSTYSLALVNREIALALVAECPGTALHSSEGPGDYQPNPEFLAAAPHINELYQRTIGVQAQDFDVTSRNMFPPRVHDVESRLNLLHCYAWEESGFPGKWVDDFNEHLQGIACLSEHVKKTLIDNGVRVPLWVNSCGVDHWERIEPNADYCAPGTGYRFLHVSSCFPRKGADILLDAYGSAFNQDDPVCLVIKTFKNIHNKIHEWIEEARAKKVNFPQIHVIEQDMSDADLKSLYLQCNALVAPSKAEGFGLPLAEAMLCGLEVITTDWSGQLDFCNSNTAWLVDYNFERAESHLGVFDSYWARPNSQHLSETLRTVFANRSKRKSKSGRDNLLENFTWASAARKLAVGAQSLLLGVSEKRPKIGWVSTWNTKCGIATYSQHLTKDFPDTLTYLAPYAVDFTESDQEGVIRCWDQNSADDLEVLSQTIEKKQLDTLVIQFNYGFFDFLKLRRFIEHQAASGKIVVVVLHSTQDPPNAGTSKRLAQLAPALNRCARVIVHSINDLNRLKALNVKENTMLFPHGVLEYAPSNKSKAPQKVFRLATYGFFLPHKGLLEFISAIEILRKKGIQIEAKMVNSEYPIPSSKALIEEARANITQKKLERQITLHTDFLSDGESLALLEDSDLIVFPYQETGESASGAVRYGLATGKPVAVTPLSIFDDVASAVFKLPGTSAQSIADGIESISLMLKAGAPEAIEKSSESTRWTEEHLYDKLARRFSNILYALNNDSISLSSPNSK